jgi:hypothetical protein
MQGVLTPSLAFWVLGSPGGLPSLIFGSVSGDLTLPSKWGCDNNGPFESYLDSGSSNINFNMGIVEGESTFMVLEVV